LEETVKAIIWLAMPFYYFKAIIEVVTYKYKICIKYVLVLDLTVHHCMC